jgi:hypothetical protein
MELLQLIFFTLSYNFMSIGNFFNTILIYLFLRLTYKKNNLTSSNILDPTMIIISFINTVLHLLVYQMGLIINIIKQNNYCNFVINIYNIANKKYVEIRNKTLYYIVFTPLKLGMKKVICNLNIEPNSNIKLKSNQDINNFLNGLLDKNQ